MAVVISRKEDFQFSIIISTLIHFFILLIPLTILAPTLKEKEPQEIELEVALAEEEIPAPVEEKEEIQQAQAPELPSEKPVEEKEIAKVTPLEYLPGKIEPTEGEVTEEVELTAKQAHIQGARKSTRDTLLKDKDFQSSFKTAVERIKDNRVLEGVVQEIEKAEGDEGVKRELVDFTEKVIEKNEKEVMEEAELLEEMKKLDEEKKKIEQWKIAESKWLQDEIEKVKREEELGGSPIVHDKDTVGDLDDISGEIKDLNRAIKREMKYASETRGQDAYIVMDFSKVSPGVVAELLDRYDEPMMFEGFPGYGKETWIDSFTEGGKICSPRYRYTYGRAYNYESRIVPVGMHVFNSLFKKELRAMLKKNVSGARSCPDDGWIICSGQDLLLVIQLQDRELKRRGLSSNTPVKVIRISPVKDEYSYTYKVDQLILD